MASPIYTAGTKAGVVSREHSQSWLRPEQSQEKARWLLLAALAREYPQHAAPLVKASLLFHKATQRESEGGEAAARYYLSQRVQHLFEMAAELESLSPPEDAIYAVLKEWALLNGLAAGVERSSLPLPWLGKFAGALLSTETIDAASLPGLCEQRAVRLMLSLDPQRQKPEGAYPQPPRVTFIADWETKPQFLKRVEEEHSRYADEMLAWKGADGAQAETERRKEVQHFRWLAMRTAERLSLRKIATFQGGHDGMQGHTAIKNALDQLWPLVFS